MEKGKKQKGMFMKLFEKLIWSFDNSSSGFSARKLSAFAAIGIAAYVTIYNCVVLASKIDESTMYIIGIWLVFALLCLGIVTAEQILRFKEGLNTEKNVEDDHGVVAPDAPVDGVAPDATAEQIAKAQAMGEVKPEEDSPNI